MSKQEKIRAALEFTNDLSSPRFKIVLSDGSVGYGVSNQIPYKNVETILKENPECCHVYSSKTAETTSPSEILSSNDKGVVHFEYKAQYRSLDGSVHDGIISNYVNFNLCN